MSPDLYIGLDVGTSGCRAIAMDPAGQVWGRAEASLAEPVRHGNAREQDPALWWRGVCAALERLFAKVSPAAVRALSVDGTSGTVVLTDEEGIPLGPALMYNDARATAEAERIARLAPARSGAHGASSGLAKLMHLRARMGTAARHVLNQAEWLSGRMLGRYDLGDENNCLKLGYDPIARRWPEWLAELDVPREWLPRVVPPGTPLGRLAPTAARELGLTPETQVMAGTTDSVAAFLATGACRQGEGVTSLGSTLVLKLLSQAPVFAPEYGLYSHRLGDYWLAGGASNSGGAVLLQYFSLEELERLTPSLRTEAPTGLDYYPLCAPGERFPVNDPKLAPRLEPRIADPAVFLQGLLEGIAEIEAGGYRLLHKLGAPELLSVRTVGGGARNAAWRRIRQGLLKVPVLEPTYTDAACGAALLAAGRLPGHRRGDGTP